MKMKNLSSAHKTNYENIIKAIADSKKATSLVPRYFQLAGVKNYQKYIYEKFAEIIKMPPFGYISKVNKGWLIVEDHRSEIAAQISLIIERYGIGVGMLILHAQQMNAGHILLEIMVNGTLHNLARATEELYGSGGEHILYIPIRQFRRDTKKLAELNIVKPQHLWNDFKIVKHQNDPDEFCYYCSAEEINTAEVTVNIDGRRLGLSRNYSLGYTFAPFGNPLSVVHFLAWDYHPVNPLDMSRTPMTVSDLVKLTEQINVSIMNYFAGTGIDDYPIIDGMSNGWAGSSIYHQHFQFFQPEYKSPIMQDHLVAREPILERDDIRIHRLAWPTPVYKVTAEESINVGLVGNDLAGIWRLQKDKHTQNIYVTGHTLGRTIYIFLRDRKKQGFNPARSKYINKKRVRKAQKKMHMGALEAAGTMIIDDYNSFKEMNTWEPDDVSEQIRLMTKAICPDNNQIDQFEKSIENLFG